MKWHEGEEILRKQGLTIFSSEEFRRATGFSPASVKHLLIRYVRKGLLLKLKARRGLYCLKSRPPHPWQLANRLLQPSYVSLETALAHYGLIPESVYAVTSVTPKVTRSFEAMNLSFVYQHIKKEAYLGYRTLVLQGETVLVGEPEKAAADYLYFVHLGKKTLNERIRWERLKAELVIRYLRCFARKGLVEWGRHVIRDRHFGDPQRIHESKKGRMMQYHLRLDEKTKRRASGLAKRKGISENTLYRMAIEEFLYKTEAAVFPPKNLLAELNRL